MQKEEVWTELGPFFDKRVTQEDMKVEYMRTFMTFGTPLDLTKRRRLEDEEGG